MLAGPAISVAASVVVRPDDLIEEPIGAENLIEHDPCVVHCVMVEMQIDRACGAQHTVHFEESFLEEAEVLLEREIVSLLH